MKKVKLNHGRFTIVDDEDFGWLSKWNWFLSNHGYAVTTTCPHKYMHRMINKTKRGFITDHINRNTLDNRKKNLRAGDMRLNSINRSEQRNNTSGHKGLSWSKRLKKWETYIWLNRKKIPLGYFISFGEAVFVREQAERRYHAI